MVFKNLSFLKAFSGLITKSNSQNNIRITKHKAKRVKNSYKRSSNIVEAFKKKSETEIELIADFRLPDLIIRMDSMIKRLKSNNVEILEGDSQPPKESPSNRNKQWLKTVPNTNPKFSALENSILLPDEHTPDWNHPRISASEEHGISYPEFGNNFGWHIRNSKVWCEELLDISLSLKLYLALKKLS
ncbi:hypothetical protein NADFUDRAFT_83343 [Nadsonia fulvescens var. elongata DSM 6958]|uniref:Uncharacterized protein n=1 Tax=Nadsonia fulvescens var. elongata DSM 6958 TaxID=857566 RepID=A0A1E3PIU4_9ASCO|nr:hypothetical protein NADFUDRAFT_83343 [Nadsonia fulvescens var. elongata DSM 6958]